MSFEKKVALVTGSATGIGASVAIDLAKTGYMVIVTGRDEENLAKVVRQCTLNATEYDTKVDKNDKVDHDNELSAIAFRADLFDMRQVDELIGFIRCKYNRLDLLVNNACFRGDIKDILAEGAYLDFERVMHINVFVPMYLIQKLLLPLKASSSLSPKTLVINISSVAGQVVVPLHLYSISKACLSEMTRQLARPSEELQAVTISPGPVLTNERPHHQTMSKYTLLNRVGTPKEISDLVMFVVNHPEMFNGQELVIDGGYIAKHRQS